MTYIGITTQEKKVTPNYLMMFWSFAMISLNWKVTRMFCPRLQDLTGQSFDSAGFAREFIVRLIGFMNDNGMDDGEEDREIISCIVEAFPKWVEMIFRDKTFTMLVVVAFNQRVTDIVRRHQNASVIAIQ